MIIARYLSREVLMTLLAVTLVLMVALVCQQSVRYLNYVAIGKIPTNVLIELISFEVPYLLALLLPLGFYLGILLAYGRLYADHEMSILQQAGFGNRRLIRVTLFLTLIITSLVLVLMLWINPYISAKRQRVMSSEEATLHLIQTLIPGRFQVSPDGKHVLYVEKISRDHTKARNIFMAHTKDTNDKHNAWMLILAKEGYQSVEPNSQEQFFVINDGFRYEGTPGEKNYRIIQYKKYWLRIPQNDISNTQQENEALPTSQLWQDYDNPKRAAEFQWRFSIGISTLLLALLAIPLSAVRPRHGRYVLLLPAVLGYIIYIHLLFVARRWLEQGSLPVALGMWWVHGLMIMVILFVLLMRRANTKFF